MAAQHVDVPTLDLAMTTLIEDVVEGVVVSKSGDKSVVVKVDRRVRHPLYEKVMRRSKNFHAHDEGPQRLATARGKQRVVGHRLFTDQPLEREDGDNRFLARLALGPLARCRGCARPRRHGDQTGSQSNDKENRSVEVHDSDPFNRIGSTGIVAFRSAKKRSFAERSTRRIEALFHQLFAPSEAILEHDAKRATHSNGPLPLSNWIIVGGLHVEVCNVPAERKVGRGEAIQYRPAGSWASRVW